MKIRLAKKHDVNQVWNIGNNVSEFRTAENVVIFWPEETLKNCIDKDDILFYVVETENKIIGFSIVNLNKSLGKAEIENIYILPEYRKNKIGTAILDEIIQELKNRKYNNVNCLADEATEFYKRYGFTKGKDFAWMDIALSDNFKRG